MRGGFVHNQVLIAQVEAHFRQLRATIHREYPTAAGRDAGFVDLFIIWYSIRIVCEAELSPARVCRDVAKAALLKADLLLIVVPNLRVAKAARARLRTCNGPPRPRGLLIWILPLGPALRRLTNKCHLMTRANVSATSIQQVHLVRHRHHQNPERS